MIKSMALCLLLPIFGLTLNATEPQRLLGLHGSLSEIAVLLGYGPRLVGADRTAQWPEEIRSLPSIGYARNLSVEGIISLRPDMVLYDCQARPESALQQMRAAGINLQEIPRPSNLHEISKRIRRIGVVLDRVERSETLAQAVERDMDAAASIVTDRPPALFVFHPRANTVNGAGSGVIGDQILEHFGFRNVLAGQEGWRSIEAESLLAAQPEYIFVSGSYIQDKKQLDSLLNQPAFRLSPAVRNQRIFVFDTMAILGYGPRVGAELLRVAQEIYPESNIPASQSRPLILSWGDL